MNPERLILFTRFPVAGKSKTRLIPALGEEGAAAFQRRMTEHTVLQAQQSGAQVEIRYTGGTEEEMQAWLGVGLQYAEQGAGDLGERMARAFQDHFDSGAERVVVIGCDCPSNHWKNIRNSFVHLKASDCVIGPAHDGGYYLIGLSRPMPRLFHRVDWGSARVLEQTLSLAPKQTVLLDTLHDVDLPEDLPAKISVVIPALNEEAHLPRTLKSVRQGFHVEAVVVDGGSSDGTKQLFPDAPVCREGRACQQNLGAEKTNGELLLFLHADTELPDGWDGQIRETLADDSVALGAFSFQVRENFPGRKCIEETANWRSRVWKLPYGDQGLFMRRSVFERLGGFPAQPIMEDYAFVCAARKLGRVVTRPEAAVTSGRRWLHHGVWKVTWVNKLMILGYHLRIPPARLAAFYRH
ncbi:TIGR04283 family arsenosugar biosynthesis glycosyltransferase [Pontiella agarivorans]|uniref:TIGR04283 family arsenosugar biosynthesis glycosyltransferase n=1 Tax=Pontiella agarivorans TaxID=3038953 RepID=A0ABU5MVH7_9BACT|nr:TIGR04283 family arsenosugar biosynthesis glycosyltransferase [Pontiella agarivorans]MDZ8118223.1 TIGR04283 family arsenosugar biosynthesis glycosyltransferase [Pontiella agarivorans]